MMKGIAASPGIAIGKAFVLPHWEWEPADVPIDVADLAYELERLSEGVKTARRELENIRREMAEVLGEAESTIFDAHLAILEDPVFLNEIQELICRGAKKAEAAVKEAVDKFVAMFDLLDDEYMKERALDVKDVGTRLLRSLLGVRDEALPPKDRPYILVGRELTPSQLAHLDTGRLLGIVTQLGGVHSHVAIVARALNIPYVFGLESDQLESVETGDWIVVDGDEGVVVVRPDADVIERYRQRKMSKEDHFRKLMSVARLPSVTRDGHAIRIEANISSFRELDDALRFGASGVGLLRSEFLYMNRSYFPDEEEQTRVYRLIAEKLAGRPLVIRTLDIGGDKQLDYFPLPKEENPSLGYRAIRIMLDRTDLFKTQLRAILRANAYGDIRILYPMVATVDDVRRANRLLDECRLELEREGEEFDPDVRVGVMIELPAAAVIADLLAREVDFFSIGTNDLVQYVLAVDRMNEQIAHLYDPYHPAVLRLLKLTADGAKKAGIPVSVCGEMAGDPLALPIWYAIGIEGLSMSVRSLLPVKHRLRESRREGAELLFEKLCAAVSSEQVRSLLLEWAWSQQVGEGGAYGAAR